MSRLSEMFLYQEMQHIFSEFGVIEQEKTPRNFFSNWFRQMILSFLEAEIITDIKLAWFVRIMLVSNCDINYSKFLIWCSVNRTHTYKLLYKITQNNKVENELF